MRRPTVGHRRTLRGSWHTEKSGKEDKRANQEIPAARGLPCSPGLTAKGVFLDKVATRISADDVKRGADSSAVENPSAACQEPWNLMSSCLAGSRLFWDYGSACWRTPRPHGTCQPASVSSFDKALNMIHSVSHGRLHYSLSTTW